MKTLNPEWNVSFDLPIVGVQSLLLEAICWDKDRFGKDYLGEFDVALEDIFANGQISQEVTQPLCVDYLSSQNKAAMVYLEVKAERCKV